MLADCRTRGIQCGKQKRRLTARRKNDMIADRNRRQRRKPRRTGGGATCPSVATLGDYAGVDRLIAFQGGELNANEDGITGANWMDPVHDRVGNMPTIPEPANLAGGLTYNAFGEITDQTDPTVAHRFAFTGREWDEDAGLYYYRARWYDPELGRFLSEDPIGFRAGDANLQRYVENAPTTRTDPSGLEEEEGVPDRAYFLYRPSRPIGFQGIGGLANQMGRLEIDRANRVLDAMRDALENAIRDLTREQQAQARAELERLISVAVTTPFSFQLDSCYQWTWDFDGRFRAPATDAFKVRIAIWKYPVWSPIFGNLSHAAIQVTLSDGAQFYLDNGWWGHAFTCHHIPWYVWRHTKGDP